MVLILTNYHTLLRFFSCLSWGLERRRAWRGRVIHLENLQKHCQAEPYWVPHSPTLLTLGWEGGLTICFPHFQASLNSSLTKTF